MTLQDFMKAIDAKLAEAKEKFGFDKPVTCRFDMRGRKAGTATRDRWGRYSMRFNKEGIEKHYHEMLNTVAHEVAHLVCFWNPLLGRDHDWGWQQVALALGCSGDRCHTMDLTPARAPKPREFSYRCTDGRIMELTERHHQALQSGRCGYLRLKGTGGAVRIYAKDFLGKAIAGPQGLGNNEPTNNATPHTENNEDTEMTNLTTEAKAWIKKEAKDLKINPVGKSLEAILDLIDERTGRTREMTLFLANGGKVKELPGFEGIKPLPNRKETSAGGKVEERKKPRKVTKETEPKTPAKASPAGDTVTLASILEELGVEGRIARRKLRNSDIAKPGSAWEWTKGHADIAKVKALLTK